MFGGAPPPPAPPVEEDSEEEKDDEITLPKSQYVALLDTVDRLQLELDDKDASVRWYACGARTRGFVWDPPRRRSVLFAQLAADAFVCYEAALVGVRAAHWLTRARVRVRCGRRAVGLVL